MVSADNVIGVTSIEDVTVLRPAERGALDGESLLANVALRNELDGVKADLGLEIPDDDGGSSSSTQPVTDGGEDEGVDDLRSLKRVKVLTLVDIPEHSSTVLTTGSTERTIGGDSDSVNITGVTDEVELVGEVVHVPDLDDLVPASRDEGRSLDVGGETNAGDPLLVSILTGEGALALTEGVPDLDGLITRTGNDLAVIGREGNGEDILGVTREAELGSTGLDIPETERTIPRAGKSVEGVLVVRGQSQILDEVVVANETTLSRTVSTGDLVTADLPDDDGLIAGSGDDEIGEVGGGGNGGNPTVVALKSTLKNELLSRHTTKSEQ